MCAEILRGIKHDCRQPCSDTRPISRETYLGKKRFSIFTQAAGLHDSAKKLLRSILQMDIRQRRKVIVNHSSRKHAMLDAQQAMRCFIGHQNDAILTRSEE